MRRGERRFKEEEEKIESVASAVVAGELKIICSTNH